MTSETISFSVAGEQFSALEFGGPDDAPLALVLHGFPDHPPSFAEFGRALTARGFRVVIPWMRGYWPSPLTGAVDPFSLVADVAGFIDALSTKGQQVVLVGHDWGALLTYVALSTSPDIADRVTAAIAVSVPHPVSFLRRMIRSPRQLQRSRYMLRLALPGGARRLARDQFSVAQSLWRQWSPGYRLPGDAWGALRETLERSHPHPVRYYRELFAGGQLHRRLRAISRPTTTRVAIVFGADDGCIGASLAHDHGGFFASSSELIVVSNCGHFVASEQPERLADIVTTFSEPTRRSYS